MEENYSLENHAGELIAKWQSILKLDDWRIRFQIVPSFEIEFNAAKVEYNYQAKVATILIADLETIEDYEGSEDYYDLENTVVHELLHITLAPLWEIWSNVLYELSPSAKRFANNSWIITNEHIVEQLAVLLTKGGE